MVFGGGRSADWVRDAAAKIWSTDLWPFKKAHDGEIRSRQVVWGKCMLEFRQGLLEGGKTPGLCS